MATITVASINVPNWERDSDVELRVYALKSYLAADNSVIVGGPVSADETENNNWFTRAACTLSGTTLGVGSIALYSTTDSSDPSALLAAYFFTTEGQMICPFGEFASFLLKAAPTNVTWAGIAAQQNS